MQRTRLIIIAVIVLLQHAAWAARTGELRAPAGDTRGIHPAAVLESPFPFTAVGAHWRIDGPPGSVIELYLSTSADGHSWSPYARVTADPHLIPPRSLADGRLNPNYGERLGQLYFRAGGDGRYVRYKIGARDKMAGRIASLSFTVIDSGAAYVSRNQQGTTGTNRAVTLEYPRPPVASRDEWGAQPPACGVTYCTTTHIGVHHTAGVGDYFCDGFDECASFVRAVQAFHIDTNGWCDVGYNYLATPDGTLWEGRGGGDDVRGAHDGHNCGSMGVANLGYFHPPFNHLWTEAQQDSVAELSAWKSDRQGIDPFGADLYAGFGASMSNIYGHRDVSATACPGDNIYAFLPDLRSRVDDKLINGPREWVFDDPQTDPLTSNWLVGTSAGDKFGASYLWTSSGSGEVCAWRIAIDAPGLYEISLWWPAGANRNPATTAFIKRPQPTAPLTVNQQMDGGRWNTLGSYALPAGNVTVGVTNDGAPGFVVTCDALRLTARH